MSERLYYNDCYLSAFEANVVEARDNGRTVFLDRTALYPTSGGQPNDLGDINGVRVVDVRDEDGQVAHMLEQPLSVGPVDVIPVHVTVDWARRYDHMQQHTGQHLLSAVWMELFKAPTLSFHMGAEVSTIELGCASLSSSQIARVEDRVNELTRQALPVEISYADAEGAEGLRKPAKRAGEIRIVSIEGVDRSACGGTHVRSTAELGPIHIRRTEKVRGNTRIEFVCGARALSRSRLDYLLLAELSRTFTTAIDDLPEKLAGMRSRLGEQEKERQRLVAEVGRYAGQQLHRDTEPDADGLRRVFESIASADDAVRAKLQAFAAEPRAIAVALVREPSGVLVACSPDCGFHAGNVLKEFLSGVGGRGGGSATFGQGALPAGEAIEDLKRRLGF